MKEVRQHSSSACVLFLFVIVDAKHDLTIRENLSIKTWVKRQATCIFVEIFVCVFRFPLRVSSSPL